MPSTEFRDSRKSTLLYLIVCAALAAGSFGVADKAQTTKLLWLPIFFTACTVAFTWLFVRPRRIVLDSEGFTLLGGFAWRPRKILWREIGEFYVGRSSRGTEVISVTFKDPPRDHSHFADSPAKPRGAVTFPQGWDLPPEQMVSELNLYRAQALGATD